MLAGMAAPFVLSAMGLQPGGAMIGLLAGGGLILGTGVITSGRRHLALSAEAIRKRGPRPPVLYLRAFRDDGVTLAVATARSRRRVRLSGLFRRTYEQQLAHAVSGIGPLIAIGNPADDRPPLGAARLYVQDEKWRSTVMELIEASQLVILHVGTTDGLLWEIRQIVERVPATKIIMSLPVDERSGDEIELARYEEFRRQSADIFPRPLPAALRDAQYLYFDSDWTPHLLLVHKDATLVHPETAGGADPRPLALARLQREFRRVTTPYWLRLSGASLLLFLALVGTGIIGFFLVRDVAEYAGSTTAFGLFQSRAEQMEEFRPRFERLARALRSLETSLPPPGTALPEPAGSPLSPAPVYLEDEEARSNMAIIMAGNLHGPSDTLGFDLIMGNRMLVPWYWVNDSTAMDENRSSGSMEDQLERALSTRYLAVNRVLEHRRPRAISLEEIDPGIVVLEGFVVDLATMATVAVYRVTAESSLEFANDDYLKDADPLAGLERYAVSSMVGNARDSVVAALARATGGTFQLGP